MPRIESMYAFIVEDTGPDDEGVIGMTTMSREYAPMWLPLVGADMARVDSLRPIVQDIAHQLGKKVTLVHFSNREEIEVITSTRPAR